jgi:hypothetical protein
VGVAAAVAGEEFDVVVAIDFDRLEPDVLEEFDVVVVEDVVEGFCEMIVVLDGETGVAEVLLFSLSE